MPDLHALLAEHAVRRPDQAALVDPAGRTTTWAELDALVQGLAGGLVERGCRPGQGVLLGVFRGAVPLLGYLAAQAAGLVPVVVGARGGAGGDTWLSLASTNTNTNVAIGALRCVLLLGGTLALTERTDPASLLAASTSGVQVLALQAHDWRRAPSPGDGARRARRRAQHLWPDRGGQRRGVLGDYPPKRRAVPRRRAAAAAGGPHRGGRAWRGARARRGRGRPLPRRRR